MDHKKIRTRRLQAEQLESRKLLAFDMFIAMSSSDAPPPIYFSAIPHHAFNHNGAQGFHHGHHHGNGNGNSESGNGSGASNSSSQDVSALEALRVINLLNKLPSSTSTSTSSSPSESTSNTSSPGHDCPNSTPSSSTPSDTTDTTDTTPTDSTSTDTTPTGTTPTGTTPTDTTPTDTTPTGTTPTDTTPTDTTPTDTTPTDTTPTDTTPTDTTPTDTTPTDTTPTDTTPTDTTPTGTTPTGTTPTGTTPTGTTPTGTNPCEHGETDAENSDDPSSQPTSSPSSFATAEQFFNRIDANQDGLINQGEVPEKLWHLMAGAVESTNNGVTASQFAAFVDNLPTGNPTTPATPIATPVPVPINQTVSLFDQLDTSHDGNITANELPADLWQGLLISDKNSDSSISRTELDAHIQSAREKFFAMLDADHDGSVTLSDVGEELWMPLSKADADSSHSISLSELSVYTEGMFGSSKQRSV